MGTDPKDIKDVRRVTLDMTVEDARELFAKIVNARNAAVNALLGETDVIEAGFYLGWLDSLLTKLASVCPDEIKTTARSQAKAALAGGVQPPQVGGGDKP